MILVATGSRRISASELLLQIRAQGRVGVCVLGDLSRLTPDLLIRTSGEQRISNFLLWQVAYAVLLTSLGP